MNIKIENDTPALFTRNSLVMGWDCGCFTLTESKIYTEERVWAVTIDEEYTLPLNIRFVHELQNLFFALTGEELKINE